MKHTCVLLFTTVTIYYGAGFSDNCDFIDCQESPAWQDAIYCKSVFHKKGDFLHVNCSWQPYLSSSSTKYTLHLAGRKSSCKSVTKGTHEILDDYVLPPDEKTTIWVSHEISEQQCVKTSNFSIIPEVKCDPPKIQHSVHSPEFLRIQLDGIGQVRYREMATTQWHIINVTNMAATVPLSRTLKSTSYVVQQRCLDKSCFHCRWEEEAIVPHELTGEPIVFVTTNKSAPGRQLVTIDWKYTKHKYVDGYNVTIERRPNSCMYNITLNTRYTSIHINLSVAFFNVFVRAYNKAGSSAIVRAVVHPSIPGDLPGKILATYDNGSIFLTWSPLFLFDFAVINWGTSYSQMKTQFIEHEIHNYSISGPFERMKRYTIIIYLYDSWECLDSTMETTFGITCIYPEEGVPRTGPPNITVRNVTKASAVIEWGDIPEEDHQGFLLGYIIHCTDMSRNTTQDLFTNSTSDRRHLLTALRSGCTYEVTVSGVTSKGAGAPSASYQFKTLSYADAELESIIISSCSGIIILTILISICAYTIHRKKNVYFPKVPNPKYSHVINVNREASKKITLIQDSHFHESYGECLNVEVTESCKEDSHSQNATPAQVQHVQVYTSMTILSDVFKRIPQTTNDFN